MTLQRPDPSEYDSYYGLYIYQAPDGDVLAHLERELETTLDLLRAVPAARETFRYAPEKWSIRELVGHLTDTEWTFAYRGLCIARADPAELPGFDEGHWARESNAHEQPLAELLDAFACARRSAIAIFRGFDDAMWCRTGIANACSFTVRSMPYISVGHEIHHRKVLVERYLA